MIECPLRTKYWVLPVILAGSALLVFVCLFSTQVFLGKGVACSSTQPLIRYLGVLDPSAPNALYEQSLIADPDPLFLSTMYNYGVDWSNPVSLRQLSVEDTAFLAPELLLGTVDFIVEYRGGEYYMPRPLDLMSEPLVSPFGVFGRESPSPRDSVERVGVVRLYRDEVLLFVEDLPMSMDEVLDATLWMPVSFRVQVLNASWVGEAFMVDSSGSEQVDRVLQSFVRQLDLAARLNDGYYRLEIAP